MKVIQKNWKFLLLMLLLPSLAGCPDPGDTPQTITLVSEAAMDGLVFSGASSGSLDFVNGNQNKCLYIGWDGSNNRYRAFVSFNLASILPGDPDQHLVIDKAILTVMEDNTNDHPFDTMGSAVVFLQEYASLATAAFSGTTLAACGVLATTGYSVYSEHSINLTAAIASYATGNPGRLQFRIQFENDNIFDDLAQWRFYSGDVDPGDYEEPPTLELEYHYEANN